jgi:hypothetical protein
MQTFDIIIKHALQLPTGDEFTPAHLEVVDAIMNLEKPSDFAKIVAKIGVPALVEFTVLLRNIPKSEATLNSVIEFIDETTPQSILGEAVL